MVARQLRKLRELAELTPTEASRLAGLSIRHCSTIERRDNDRVELPTLRAFAKLFGCSIDYLAANDGPEPEAAAVKRAVARARRKLEKQSLTQQ